MHKLNRVLNLIRLKKYLYVCRAAFVCFNGSVPTNKIVPNVQDEGCSLFLFPPYYYLYFIAIYVYMIILNMRLLLLRGSPVVGVIRRKLPRTQTELEKVCCVKMDF